MSGSDQWWQRYKSLAREKRVAAHADRFCCFASDILEKAVHLFHDYNGSHIGHEHSKQALCIGLSIPGFCVILQEQTLPNHRSPEKTGLFL